MKSTLTKLLSIVLLSALSLPTLVLAASDVTPFSIVQKSSDQPDVPQEVSTQQTVDVPAPAALASPAPQSWAAASALSPILSEDKDVKAEARLGEDNPGRYEKLSEFAGRFNDKLFGWATGATETGEKWVRNFLVTVARDAKNFFTILAFTFIVISILMFFFGSKGEEDAKKIRGSIIYTTLGIMLMQISYVLINTLFNKDVGAWGGATGIDFYKSILLPIINLVRLLASFAFLAMAFMAFFQMVSSGWDAKAREKGISTIVGAVVGFVLIKLAEVLVTSVYGKISCPTVVLGRCQWNLLTDPNLSDTLKIFTTIINYVNGFIGLVTVLIIMYAGWNILFNGEDGMKKGKWMIKWIVVGLGLLATSYILFRFIILRN